MKCREIDFIAYAEGRGSAAIENHVSQCPACREDLDRFTMFMNEVMPAYRKGKQQEEELERRLASLDQTAMKPLPARIAVKVRAMKENNLAARLKRIIGGKRENAGAWIEEILHPRMESLPASPKDITQTKKLKPKPKKTSPKKRRTPPKRSEA